MQRAALHEQRGHRTATAVEPGLDDDALRVLVGVGPQVQRGVRGEQDALEQVVDVQVRPRGDVDEQRVAAVLLGDQPVLGELLAHLGRVGVLLVDLVHRHHDRHVGRLGVVERLDRLRHDAVIGRDDQHDDVGGRRTTGTHGGERLVTGGVDEGDRAVLALVLDVHLVGTDVLGDAAGLVAHDVRLADRVEQAGLAVVDVTHDGDDRRAGDEVLVLALVLAEGEIEGLEQLAVLVLGADDLHLVVQLGTEQLQGLLVDRLRRGDHLAEVEHHLDERGRVGVDLVGEVGQRRAAGQAQDVAVAARNLHAADRRRGHVVELGPALLLALATARGRTATAAERAGRAGAASTAAAAARTATGAAAVRTAAAGTTRTAAGPPGRHRRAAAVATAATAAGTAAPGPPGRPPRARRDAAGAAGRAPGPPGPPGRRDRPAAAGHHARVRPRRHHAGVRARAAGAGAAAGTPAGRGGICARARRCGPGPCVRAGAAADAEGVVRDARAGRGPPGAAGLPGCRGAAGAAGAPAAGAAGAIGSAQARRLGDRRRRGLGDDGRCRSGARRPAPRRLGGSGCCRGLLGGRLLRRLGGGGRERLAQLALDGRLDGGRCGLHVLAHLAAWRVLPCW